MQHENAEVIVLNGTGSSGKTTLARALQAAARRPFLHLAIDAFLGGMPRRYVGFGLLATKGLRFRANASGQIEALEPGPAMHRLVRGLHRSVAAIAARGNPVVVDHVLLKDDWLTDCAEVLPNALFVGLHCSREVVQQRTLLCGDRPPGYDMFAVDIVHRGRTYDIEVDTTDSDIPRCGHTMLERLYAGPSNALSVQNKRRIAPMSRSVTQ